MEDGADGDEEAEKGELDEQAARDGVFSDVEEAFSNGHQAATLNG